MNGIKRIRKIPKEEKCNIIIGIGGGKSIDTAKAVSNFTKSTLAILPTIESTDAPTSSVSAVYSDKGIFEKYIVIRKIQI